MEDLEYDFDTYIWQIQFTPWQTIEGDTVFNTTIDYINRQIEFRKTEKRTNVANIQSYEIDDECFEGLLKLSKIEEIHRFESIPEEELSKLDIGYRDCYRMRYTYFTHGTPPMASYELGIVYRGNPIEEILKWIKVHYPESEAYLGGLLERAELRKRGEGEIIITNNKSASEA